MACGFKNVYFLTRKDLHHFLSDAPPVHWVNNISGATKNEMKSVLWYGAGLSWQ